MKNEFNQCADSYIYNLRVENRFPTAHIYGNAVNYFTNFFIKSYDSFDQISKDNLRKYE